jgi:transcription elongation factor SPT5
VGKTVTIASGPYKNYKGLVKSATPTHVRIELEAQMKTVNIKREQLQASAAAGYGGVGASYAPTATPARASGYDAYAGSRTPSASGGKTPMHPSMTPMHPSMTPAYGGGWATPSHPSSGSMTPSRAGNMTPYRNASSAWGSQTPAHTPYQEDYDAATPADGATPGSAYGYTPADTPGYGSAPTPALDAATPAFDTAPYVPGQTPAAAPTPAAGTPADHLASDYDDLPRYDLWRGLLVRRPDGGLGVVTDVDAASRTLTVQSGSLDSDSHFQTDAAHATATDWAQVQLVPPDKERQQARLVKGSHAGENVNVQACIGDTEFAVQSEAISMFIAPAGTLGRVAA